MLTQVKAQEAFEVLKSWLKWSLWLWGWMTSARLILFGFFLPELHQKEAFDIAWAFFQGARFDLAVIGILWSPFWILLSIWPFFSSFKKGLRILKGYWLIGVFVLFNLHWLDFFWFKYKKLYLKFNALH